MRTKVVLVSILLVFVLGCNLFPVSDGVTFSIGEMKESDIPPSFYSCYPFTSDTVVYATNNDFDNLTKIVDGNLSTGINDTWAGESYVGLHIIFENPIYINSITAKPNFEGGASNYSFQIDLHSDTIYDNWHWPQPGGERTFNINCSATMIEFVIYKNETYHYWFNDFIINYTPDTSYNSSQVLQAVSDMSNSIDSLQSQINTLKAQINDLYKISNDFNKTIEDLNKSLNFLNDTIKSMNMSQETEILENITNLWTSYQQMNISITNLFLEFSSENTSTQNNISKLWTYNNQLNNSLQNLYQTVQNLNLTTPENITKLENDLSSVKNDIQKIQIELNNLSTNISKIAGIENQLNQINSDIYYIQENITNIKNNMPVEYNDSKLLSQINDLKQRMDSLEVNLIEIQNSIPPEYNDSELQTQIDTLLQKIASIKEDLTEIQNNMPVEYKDSEIKTRITALEYENSLLNNQLDNQTTLINNLNTELDNLITELDVLNTEMDNLTDSQKEKIIEKEADNTIAFGGVGLGILGLIVAMAAILLLLKRKEKSPHKKEK